MKAALACLSLLAGTALAGQSFFNILNEETGDFGGAAFQLRDEIETFIDVDFEGDVSAYGFYVPTLSRLGLLTPNATVDPPLGATPTFDTSTLAKPYQVPYKFVGINFNPGGHPPEEWLIPHFDIHLYLAEPGFIRSIECEGTGFPPCLTTPHLAEKFSKMPSSTLFPAGYVNNPMEWVPAMGAHLTPPVITNDFETVPATIYGSYDGKIIFHEPMVASAIFLDVEATGPKTFDFIQAEEFPTIGRFFTTYTISVEGDRYKFTFGGLVDAPEFTSGNVPLFKGTQTSLGPTEVVGSVSPSKDCLISTSTIIDGGYLVTNADGEEFCCRARGTYSGVACTRETCTGTAPLTSPSDNYFFDTFSAVCYARCVAR